MRRAGAAGHGDLIAARTGLRLDPYFSATKIAWLLDTVDGARAAAQAGHLAFGTIDSFLLWRLTEGAVHATDATNACRTLLFDIHRGDWDDELLSLFDIPRAMLPEVRDTAGMFGTTTPDLRRPDRDSRHRRRPAGGVDRPGLLPSGHGEIHLRHRLLRAVEYRPRRPSPAAIAC